MNRDYQSLKIDAVQFFTYHDRARLRLQDQRRGQPAAADPNSGGTSSGGSSPVERALGLGGSDPTRDTDWTLPVDTAANLLAELDTITTRLHRDMARAARIVMANTPHAPTSRQRSEVKALNDPDPECAHCRQDCNRHEPYRTISDVGGILPAPVPLCRWHIDFAARVGRRARPQETDMHHQGRTIRIPA